MAIIIIDPLKIMFSLRIMSPNICIAPSLTIKNIKTNRKTIYKPFLNVYSNISI